MAINDLADRELVAEIGRKDYAAFNEFWRRYNRLAMFYFQRLLKDKCLAEDCYQQFFITIWSKSSNYRGGDVKAYCYGIMRNIYKQTIRKNTQESPMSSFGEERQEKIMNDFVISQNDGTSAYNKLLHEEIMSRIKEVGNNISGLGKRIFVLRVESELKWKDISQRLMVSQGTCKTTYRRLCKKLKGVLREYA